MNIRSLVAFGALLTVPVVALAQMDGMGMGAGMAGPMLPPGEVTEATTALMAAHETMTAAHVQLTGNPDRDFVLMMIPHHQGAIDMAEVELQFGTDPEIRAMAQAIIDAQEAEIAAFEAWLAAHP